ncbi:MAG: class I SAM-dependent methyltransferase [Candidatus Zixiibacteriota bacterium]
MARLQTNDPDVWNDAYETGVSPWDGGAPDEHLVHLVQSGKILAGRVLDIGCGTGNESIYLSKAGFIVTGLDISRDAIEKAREKAKTENVSTEFLVADILGSLPFANNDFDLVIDRACFHFVPAERIPIYMENLGRILRSGGSYILYAASDQDAHIRGPVHYTRDALLRLFAPEYRIDDIQIVTLSQHALQPRPYLCRMVKLATSTN